MASVNKVILVGHLGADPEMRYLPSGEAVANLRLATTDVWKDKAGNKQEATELHRVSFFSRQAEICGQYLKKGAQIYVEGSIRTRKWQDKDGQDRYTTEIRGDQMKMLGGRPSSADSAPASRPASAAAPPAGSANSNAGGGFQDFADDIPFGPIGRRLALMI